MKLCSIRLTALLMSTFLLFSKSYADTQPINYLELLGKPISTVDDIYSCSPKIISGPSKKKIICANSDEKLFAFSLKNRIVSITIFQFTNKKFISDLSLGFPKSCQPGSRSKLGLRLNCDSGKNIFLELNVENSELISEFCFSNFCNSNFN